jgi:fumarate hydratase class I
VPANSPSSPEFGYTEVLPLGPDETEYRRLGLDPGRVVQAAGRTFLEVPPATITALVRESVHDIQHLLRPSHLAQLRAIVDDPEASANDRFVATDLLRNACVSAGGVLPMCQDTGTAIVIGKRTETVLTAATTSGRHPRDLRGLPPLNLRYSQMAPTSFWDERNTGTNLPAQVELYSAPGQEPEYEFLVHGQGRRLGQQDLPLPGDQGAAEPAQAGRVPGREAALAGHRGLPALPPRRSSWAACRPSTRSRWPSWPRPATWTPAGAGLGARARLPRPRPGAAGAWS